MNKQDYDRLADIVFHTDADGKPTYPGYRPDVLEIPHGDGKVDAQKRYAHVATKYLRDWIQPGEQELCKALVAAHRLSLDVADALQVPTRFSPDIGYGALRILEYPVGATSNLHTDFDLFSLVLYRDDPSKLVLHDAPRADAASKPSLTVLRDAQEHERYSRTGKWIDARAVIVQCSCGSAPFAIGKANLTRIVSCGCWKRSSQFGAMASERNGKHRDTDSSEYQAWRQLRYRCQDPDHAAYPYYGGRGIMVCARWQTYENFLADMGRRPSVEHSLDRIDNDGNYEPDNCRWATRSEQQRNKRASTYERPTAELVTPVRSLSDRLTAARKLNAQLHIGELGELIGLGPATPHEVVASGRPQHSIVYFAIPDHAAVLPTGQTVGEWLHKRMARSRVTK